MGGIQRKEHREAKVRKKDDQGKCIDSLARSAFFAVSAILH
jgi:hypothetical protein